MKITLDGLRGYLFELLEGGATRISLKFHYGHLTLDWKFPGEPEDSISLELEGWEGFLCQSPELPC